MKQQCKLRGVSFTKMIFRRAKKLYNRVGIIAFQ